MEMSKKLTESQAVEQEPPSWLSPPQQLASLSAKDADPYHATRFSLSPDHLQESIPVRSPVRPFRRSRVDIL